MSSLKEIKKIELVGGGVNLKLKYVLLALSTFLLFSFVAPSLISAEETEVVNNEVDDVNILQSANHSDVMNEISSEEKNDETNEDTESSNFDEATNSEDITNDEDIVLEPSEQEDSETEINISEPEETSNVVENVEPKVIEGEGKLSLQNLKQQKDESQSISNTSSNYFKFDDRDAKIKEIKLNLMKIGFGTHWKNPTTYFGSDTEKVVREFQEYYGLTINGIIDDNFLNKLEKILSSEYQKGKRSENVLVFKRNLMRVGFGTHWKNPTNYYGPDTEKVVREFQEANGLVVNGIGDSITLSTLETLLQEIEKNGFRKGMKSVEIQRLKQDLMKVGFGTHWKNPSTYYGSDTEKVVKEFQKYYSLTIDGTLNKETQNKLAEILSSPFQKGNRSEEIQVLKYDLMKVGFGTHWKNPTTYFGSDTEEVVREFQQANRLIVNGILDEVTKQRLKDMLENGFRKGMGSPFIQEFKKDLMKAGFGTHWKNPTNYYGADTEKVVKEFQKYYSLTIDGTLNKETQKKLEEVLNSPYRKGKSSKKIQELKIDLKKVGFGLHWKNPTEYYGADTEKVVREFQKEYKLAINGILDEVTLKKIEELKAQGLTPGMRTGKVQQMKYDLMKAGFGTHWNNPTNYYGPDTEKVVREFQAYYSLHVDGEMHLASLNKLKEVINSPYQRGKSSSKIKQLKEDLKKIGFGTHWKNPTNYYGADTEKVVKEFQKAYKLVQNGILDEVSLNVLKVEVAKRKSVKPIKIFIDPGHGGKDSGAHYKNETLEKILTLDIAKRIEKYLKQYYGVEIKMARKNDTYLTLAERTKMANDWSADYYVSVHINAGGGTGFESFIYNSPTQDEIKKQSIIHDHIANNLEKEYKVRDRGKKRANFHVLRESKMSAILFEYLFIDTTSDRNKLNNASFRDRLAKLTAEGIAKAFNLSKK